MSTLGERFVHALAGKDTGGLRDVFRSDLNFRGMTPGRFWEADTCTAFLDDVLLGTWFEPSDKIVKVLEVNTGNVGPRERISYQLLVENPDGRYLVEQQAYYDVDGDQIGWLRIMCAGYQPIN